MIFHIVSNGDPSVGIPAEHAILEVDVLGVTGDDRKDLIAHIRVEMREAFKHIWDAGSVKVLLDEELDADEPEVDP